MAQQLSRASGYIAADPWALRRPVKRGHVRHGQKGVGHTNGGHGDDGGSGSDDGGGSDGNKWEERRRGGGGNIGTGGLPACCFEILENRRIVLAESRRDNHCETHTREAERAGAGDNTRTHSYGHTQTEMLIAILADPLGLLETTPLDVANHLRVMAAETQNDDLSNGVLCVVLVCCVLCVVCCVLCVVCVCVFVCCVCVCVCMCLCVCACVSVCGSQYASHAYVCVCIFVLSKRINASLHSQTSILDLHTQTYTCVATVCACVYEQAHTYACAERACEGRWCNWRGQVDTRQHTQCCLLHTFMFL